tara:strand:+ start:701 stop:1588 length:888 start_codon:yes stop_codon:yes gene_type:complete
MSKIERAIIKDFQGNVKNRAYKLSFLKKYTITDLYVSKITGTLIPKEYFSNKEVLRLWDKKFNRNVYSSTSPHFLSRHIYTLETFNRYKNLKNLKVADIGCGDGGLIKIMQKMYNPKKIVGFDYSKKNIKNNKKNLQDFKTKLFQNEILEIDEKKFKKYFDVIFMTWTLSCCAEPLKVLEKIKKILKKNGHLVIAESSRILVPPTYKIEYYFRYGEKTNTFNDYPWRFSFNSLRNLLLTKNFETKFYNNFNFNDNLIIIAQNKTKSKQKFITDNPKVIKNFFKEWINFSKKFKTF